MGKVRGDWLAEKKHGKQLCLRASEGTSERASIQSRLRLLSFCTYEWLET